MNESTNGRGGSFLIGARAGAAGMKLTTFEPRSVLDKSQRLSSPNGMSDDDKARQPLGGGHFRSINGQSQGTYDDKLVVGNLSRTFG